MADLREATVEAANYTTFYLTIGSGEPVICLHSADPGSHAAVEFRHNFGPLGAHFRVVAPDLVGFGRTQGACERIANMSDVYVDHILAFLDVLGIRRAHFVGNSRGGLISIAIAARHPERVNRIVLLGNAGGGISAEYAAQVGAAYGAFHPDRESLRKFLAGSFHSLDRDVPPEVFDAYLQTSARQYAQYDLIGGPPMDVPDLRDDLTRIAAPVLYIFGKNDQRWPPLPQALDTFVKTPNSRFYVLSECGHHPQTEYPEDFNVLATSFLKGELH